MSILSKAITYGLFPTVFFTGIGCAFFLLDGNVDHRIILGGCVLPAAVIALIMERLHPEREAWNRSRGDVVTDLNHNLVSQVMIPYLLQISLITFLMTIAQKLSSSIGFSLWPNSIPLVLQFVFAMIFSQFFEYWYHRLAHTNPLIWRLHATHHSPGRLYWFNAGRFHPLDTAISYTVSAAPLAIFGAPKEVVLLYSVWAGIHGIFQHCNIKIRLGPLNYIFSMAELHRWHHSRTLEEANTNYGNNIILWDLVFGTYYFPKDREPPTEVGLSGDEIRFPENYWGQLLSPFQWKKLHDHSKK